MKRKLGEVLFRDDAENCHVQGKITKANRIVVHCPYCGNMHYHGLAIKVGSHRVPDCDSVDSINGYIIELSETDRQLANQAIEKLEEKTNASN